MCQAEGVSMCDAPRRWSGAGLTSAVVLSAGEQALEAATWSALLKAPRAVLAGDHRQLPPTIISQAAAQQVPLPALCCW